MVNLKLNQKKGTMAEFDVIIIADDTVFVNETKSKPKKEYVDEFLEKLQRLFEFFPEFSNKKIVPLFSFLHIQEDILQYLTRNNIYALGMGEEIMEVLNFEEVKAL